MKSYLRLLLSSVFGALLICACDINALIPTIDDVTCLEMENNSNDSICVYVASGERAFSPTTYPDTLLPADRRVNWSGETGTFLSEGLGEVAPHSVSSIYMSIENKSIFDKPSKEKWLKRIPVDTLSFFIISQDSITKYGYDHVAKNNMVLMRYDLSKDDIRLLDFLLYYPPSHGIEGMKIHKYQGREESSCR